MWDLCRGPVHLDLCSVCLCPLDGDDVGVGVGVMQRLGDFLVNLVILMILACAVVGLLLLCWRMIQSF